MSEPYVLRWGVVATGNISRAFVKVRTAQVFTARLTAKPRRRIGYCARPQDVSTLWLTSLSELKLLQTQGYRRGP